MLELTPRLVPSLVLIEVTLVSASLPVALPVLGHRLMQTLTTLRNQSLLEDVSMVCWVLVPLFARAKSSSTHLTRPRETHTLPVSPVVMLEQLLLPLPEELVRLPEPFLTQDQFLLIACGSHKTLESMSSTASQVLM